MKAQTAYCPAILSALCCACQPSSVQPDTANHLSQQDASRPVRAAPIPPLFLTPRIEIPRAAYLTDHYTVNVANVPVNELLHALARDSRINLDIHPGISGHVSISAVDQTLPDILTRLSRQADLRFEIHDRHIEVMPDTPYLKSYQLDYVNIARESSGAITVSAQMGGGSTGSGESGYPARTITSPTATTARIQSQSRHHLWDALVQNVKDLLRETDKLLPSGSRERIVQTEQQGYTTQQETTRGKSERATLKTGGDSAQNSATTERVITFREAASVIANPETGILSVRATAKQHERVGEFIDQVARSASRQVLIEATIVEVQLTRTYQQGIDWSALNIFDTGLRVIQRASGAIAGAPGASLLEVGYDSSRGQFTSAIRLLESFGNVRVLSSPKLAVMNNQTAVMKVVDDKIYFTYEIHETDASSNGPSKTTINSTLHSVPVGLVLAITPQVGRDGAITLNMRPSLSRVIDEVVDPSLFLLKGGSGISNRIPVIRAREFDSVMKIRDGNIAVMGGLMEDATSNLDDTVPGLAATPVLGRLFENRNDTRRKTELVIFVRPTLQPAARDTLALRTADADFLTHPQHLAH